MSFDKDRYRRLRNRALDPNRRGLVVAPRARRDLQRDGRSAGALGRV